MTSGSKQADDVEDILGGLRAFLQQEVFPRHTAMAASSGVRHRMFGPDGRMTHDVLEAMKEVREASARAGYYTMLVPTSVGGGGLGFEALFRIWELIALECGGEKWLGFSAVAHWSRGPSHLLAFIDPSVRAELLPGLMDGSTTICFGMSEPDAGSDAWMMRTRAERVEGGWRLAGTKQWVTNAPYADYAFVFAVTDPALVAQRQAGISAFLVPTTAPGFRSDGVIEMFGHPGGDEGTFSLDDVFVPDSCLVGEENKGLPLAMSGVSVGRLYNTARSVGLARWSLNKALAYAEERVTFGRPIIENQGISFPLAESAMEIHAARLMGLDCARSLDQGQPARKELSMAKAYATEVAVRAVDRSVQTHGAMGFTNELGLSEAWQIVRRICVADGSAEILRNQIVKHLRREISH